MAMKIFLQQALLNWLLDLQAFNIGLHRTNCIVLAAAKAGGIYAIKTYPADFLLENLKIQNNVIETAWRCGVKRLCFLK